jgi:pimeloyl-ACP methyl ester carboxylesterase
MQPRRLKLAPVLAAAAALPLCGVLHAQPTFGKPKPRPRPETETPANPGADTPSTETDLLGSTGNPAAPGWNEWRDTDPERLAPSSDATPGKAYAWKSKEGLRYTWTLPKDYKKGEGYDLVVLCHPNRADFRWGTLNHPAPATAGERGFRPTDIVIGIDGTSANERNPDIRTFEPEPASIIQFRDLVLEVSRTFPVDRIYLYGMGGGGEFVQCFAAAFPALTDGIVVHGCSAPPDCVKKGRTPLVLIHGAKDLLIPLNVSFDARRAYTDAEHTNVRLRILQSFNDFPNPVRASECLDWVKAMRTDDADQLLASVRSMLTPKRPDEYEYRTAVWFGAAREALGRLIGEGENPIKDASAEDAATAKALIDKIEAEGEKHIAVLRPMINSAGLSAQALDGKPWLGHLIAMREDFRGVKSVDAFMTSIGYDELLAAHDDAALGFVESWAPDGDAATAFDEAVSVIQRCWLSQFLPIDIGPRMRFFARKADELKFPPDSMEKYEYFQNWEKGWKDGLDAYEVMWRKWEGL